MMDRRHFLKLAAAAGGTALAPSLVGAQQRTGTKPIFEISLAEWSLHRALQSGKMTNLDFPRMAREDFGIRAVEYVNSFFKDKAQDEAYLEQLKGTCKEHGVRSVLIMVDGEGRMGAATDAERRKTVDRHKKWVTAARYLGCHSIRVNAHGEGDSDEAKAENCVKGLTALSTFAADHDINVIVENHGGLSSNGVWMAGVLRKVGMENCGSLPDFGNFHGYDRYQGIKDLMPFAKGVSAKSHDFDEQGNEVNTDYAKAIGLVLDAGYRGYIGVEYEGGKLPEAEGIRATRRLLERVRDELSPGYRKS